MNWQHIKDVAKVEVRRLRTLTGAALLAALPWAGEIRSTVASNLPALQPYLPDGAYKFVGAAVIVAGMVLSIAATHRAVKAANDNA